MFHPESPDAGVTNPRAGFNHTVTGVFNTMSALLSTQSGVVFVAYRLYSQMFHSEIAVPPVDDVVATTPARHEGGLFPGSPGSCSLSQAQYTHTLAIPFARSLSRAHMHEHAYTHSQLDA